MPSKITRLPLEYSNLDNKVKEEIFDVINIERKVFHDLIEEGKEILEFGDDLKDDTYEMYLFDNPEYSQLVSEFLKKSEEMKKKIVWERI